MLTTGDTEDGMLETGSNINLPYAMARYPIGGKFSKQRFLRGGSQVDI